MITTQKIVKLFSNTLASLVCLMSTYVFALELPYSARLVLSDETDVKNISVEISAWDREKGISRLDFRGRTTTKVFQIDGTSLTLDQMLQPIITHLNDKQFSIELYCNTNVCGGFNFRKNLTVSNPPFMLVNVANYSVITAVKNSSAISLVASKLGNTIYLQILSIGTTDNDLILQDQEPLKDNYSSKLKEDGAIVLDDLIYRSGSADLGPGPFESLSALANFLKGTPSSSIILVGHSDAIGELRKNIELSRNRAQAVVDRLIKDYGIDQSRISAQGIGFLSPKTNNSTEKSRKKNRRVEAILIMP
jgi:OOP family OmpA-OmpF porin|tara:strand:- start:530 stop:1447 length:918 start_codon:yes stop_codon:yes gene_type:complete